MQETLDGIRKALGKVRNCLLTIEVAANDPGDARKTEAALRALIALDDWEPLEELTGRLQELRQRQKG